jgi:L-erythro-3,5-diaminohexanoate dehydrogenase
MITTMKNGNPYGTHRVLEPQGVLPQPAERLNNNMALLWDNEILIEVEALNVDSASFTQIKAEAGGDEGRIRELILGIVAWRGKLHNPVTGSGGMLIGQVAAIGERLVGSVELAVGDRIATLISLSLTPLQIDEILDVNSANDQVRIKGKAILFESGLFVRLPDDLPPRLALAVLDVAGAPAQTARLVEPGATVLIIGATGKSGMLCAYEARKRAGKAGMVIGIGAPDDPAAGRLAALGLCDTVLKLDATDALACHREIDALTGGCLADLVINCVNIQNTELASILCCRDRGKVYFFSMATSFTRAALGAEGAGKDIDMIIGNGYARGHAEFALNLLRESEPIRELYQELYGKE